jgi:hypothetical protein
VIREERSAASPTGAAEIAAAHTAGKVPAAKCAGATHVSAKCAAASHPSHARSAHPHMSAAHGPATKRTATHVPAKCSAGRPPHMHAAHVRASHAAEMRPAAAHVAHAAEVCPSTSKVATPAAEVTSATTHVTSATAVAATTPTMSTAASAVPEALAWHAEQSRRNQRHTYRDQSFTHDPSPLRAVVRPHRDPRLHHIEILRSSIDQRRFLRFFHESAGRSDRRLLLQIPRIAQPLLLLNHPAALCGKTDRPPGGPAGHLNRSSYRIAWLFNDL